MRRRKNIIISAITCMFSICLMMFGVYAASNPNVSINGQVSYTARDASVLVQGKMYGADGYESVDYKIVTDPTSPTTDDVLTNSVSQYVDYTSADQNKTTLATWSLGDQLKFYEDQNGIRKVNVCLKFTNLSNYPVMATAVFENKTATNVKTTQSPTDGKMAMTTIGSVGSDCEMSFVFEVEDDSKNANIDFKLVVTIEKTVLQNYTATFSSGTKQFSNQSNAKSYDISETTVLEEAPELYFEENGANRRVALWYDNQECQGEPIKFPYVLSGNKTFYAVWEQNTKIFNFFDYGKDIQVMFDGYNAFRAQSLGSFVMVNEYGFEDYSNEITIEDRSILLFFSENIAGIKFYNNFLYDNDDKAFYIIPTLSTTQAKDVLPTKTIAEYKSLRIGYSYESNADSYSEDGYFEMKFVTDKVTDAPNVQVYQSNNTFDTQIGFNITNNLKNVTKFTVTLHSGSEHQFVTGHDENNQYQKTQTLTVEIAFLSRLNNNSICYSSIYDEYNPDNEGQIYVSKWYDNPEHSGEPLAFPYKLTQNTDLYADWGYNSKSYSFDSNAKNIEIWVRGKKILKAKDASFVPELGESTDSMVMHVQNDENDNTIFAYYEFIQSDTFEYIDTNFTIAFHPFIGFMVDYYQTDWNPIDFSQVKNLGQLLPGCNSMFMMYKEGDEVIVGIQGADDLVVYVDGVEAQYTLG